jgi:hypothetical protein
MALELRNAYLEQIIQRLIYNSADGAALKIQPALYYTLPAIQQGPLQSTTGSNALASKSYGLSSIHPVLQTPTPNKELEHLFYVAAPSHPQLNPSQDRHAPSEDLNMLPQEQVSRLAVDAFFQYASTLFYVTTVEQSTQLLQKVYETHNPTLQDVCELCALAAIGSQYDTIQITNKERAAYFYIASTRLEKVIMRDSLQGLRIFIYLSMNLIMEKSSSAQLLIGGLYLFSLFRGYTIPDGV